METLKTFCFLLILVTILGSCEETIELDLDQTEERVIIEGLVSTMSDKNFVKISKSLPFYETGRTPRVTNAVVTVSDQNGEVFNLVHNPGNHPDSAGIYIPSPPFSGVVGHTYFLEVVFDETIFTGSDKLTPVLDIDSLAWGFSTSAFPNLDAPDRIYEVLLYAENVNPARNFLLFKFYRNDSIIGPEFNNIFVADDQFIGDKIEGLSAPVLFAKNDTARVEIYSLSQPAFAYYNDLINVLNNDGGLFSPPPANPRSNLSNGALGFFQASALSTDFIIVDPDN